MLMSSEYQIGINKNFNIQDSLTDIMSIFCTWIVNSLGDTPFVKGQQ